MSADIAEVRRSRISSATAYVRSDSVLAQVLRFGLHFAEMAVAMELGMMPLGPLLSALGYGNLSTSSPNAYSLAMNLSMVLPMAAWMLVRRHGWRLTAEMAAAMIVPGSLVAVASVAGLVPGNAATTAMGTLMWVGMFAAMAFRWRAYAQHCHTGHGH